MIFVFPKRLGRGLRSLILCLLIGTVAQIEPPRSAAEIQLSDDPKLENTTASSSYLPLDSWVYPAMERLYSLGYLDTAFLGLRPWTRISCARMLAEAEKKVAASESSYVIQLFNSLEEEFSGDLAALGSPAYTTGIGLWASSGHRRTQCKGVATVRTRRHHAE